MKYDKFLYGGDYNPEQWLDYPDILEKDIEYMKEAGINTVTLGVFSWSKLEPKEGEYNFGWLEEIIDKLYANGIYTILATPSGARPKWLADKYEEVLRCDENRNRNFFGFRHNHCYTSPVYREKIAKIDGELAKRFGEKDAVIMWHISNELGGECHCDLCQDAFRKWLKNRYKTIDVVNKKWNTTFWSHVYDDFEQIEAPSPRGETFLMGLNLDWKRFVTDQTADFVKWEIEAIRKAGSDKPSTVNMMYYYDGLDYNKFKDVIDITSWDNYPTWHSKNEYETALDCGMYHDIIRGIKGEPFLLMESCPSSTNWQSVSKLIKPGMLEAASLHAVAHGSQSVLYFQIRQSRGASEKFHGAVIDHYGGKDTRVFREVTDLGQVLESIEEVIDSEVRSEVAVIYDFVNRWAVEGSQGPRNIGVNYKEAILKSYTAFKKQGINVDVIGADKAFDDYKIVVAPMMYMYDESFVEKVKAFVKSGGQFVLTYWSGVVDENDLCYLGGFPHGLIDVLGLRSTEIDGLYEDEKNSFVLNNKSNMKFKLKKNYECNILCDIVATSTAKAIMEYGDDFYKGKPALTVNNYEYGKAYYVAADAEQEFYNDFYENLVKEAGVTKYFNKRVDKRIEVNIRQSEDNKYIFMQNFSQDEVEVEFPKGNFDIIYGDCRNGRIKGFGTVILKSI